MQGDSILLLALIGLSLLGTDYLIQQNLIVRCNLGKVLIGLVIS